MIWEVITFFLFSNLWIPLILTILIEFLVYFAFFKKDIGKLILFSILINSVTNPLANFFYYNSINFYALEIFVFVIEIFLIKFLFKIEYKKAMIISFIANVASVFLGIAFLILWQIL